MLKFTPKNIESKLIVAKVPFSKSIVNRQLIILKLLEQLPDNFQCDSTDNEILQNALVSNETNLFFANAGTPARLYLAYAALLGKSVTITGDESLNNRPFYALVDTLQQAGAKINFLEKEGYLPLYISNGVDLQTEFLSIDGSVSSQFISAILLIAPFFKNGLNLQITGNIQSEKYIQITIAAMKHHGVKVISKPDGYFVPNQKYCSAPIVQEGDWSAAAFLYNWVSADVNSLKIENLQYPSIQGDAIITEWYRYLGVNTTITETGVILQYKKTLNLQRAFDMLHYPDVFPALIACCAFHKIEATFLNIHNLAFKESNRLLAMENNLKQTGCVFNYISANILSISFNEQNDEKCYKFCSFNDHRIAMALSIFAFKKEITIDDEMVVGKSFPHYWDLFAAFVTVKKS